MKRALVKMKCIKWVTKTHDTLECCTIGIIIHTFVINMLVKDYLRESNEPAIADLEALSIQTKKLARDRAKQIEEKKVQLSLAIGRALSVI